VYLVYPHDIAAPPQFYALKTFKDEFLSDRMVKDRFRKEAQVWVDMGSHPYLVRPFLVDLISDRLFIASEYIAPEKEGGPNSLDAYLKLTLLDLVQSLRWAVQFCHGMEFAYSKGIRAHRDIKPSNIMIDHNMIVKITDFGLAGIYEQSAPMLEREQRRNDGTSIQTMLGSSIGTPEYMPPEQFTDFSACNERSDIYSFGVVLYQMASGGKLPFSAENTEYRWMALRHLHHEKPLPKLSSPFFPMIQKCLEKESKNRYQSFEALRADLAAVLKRQTGEIIKVPNTEEQTSQEWNNKGISFESMSKFEQAIECFDKAINIDPRNDGAWSNKGNSLRCIGRDSEAMGCYNNAIKTNPSNARAWANKGFLLATLGQLNDSLQCLHRALDIEPINPYILWQIVGSLGISEFKPAEIRAVCQKVIGFNLKPYDYVGLSNLGLCYLQIEDTDNALAKFLEAEKLDGQDSGLWFELMEVYYKKQDASGTLKYCDKLISANIHFDEAISRKSSVLFYTGDKDKSLDLLKSTLNADPTLDLLWFMLSSMYEDTGNITESLKAANKCLQVMNSNANPSPKKIQNIKQKIIDLESKISSSLPTVQKAIQQMQEAEKRFFKQKPHVYAIKQVIQVSMEVGDKQNALKYCDVLIDTMKDINLFANKAIVMFFFGDTTGAIKLLHEILNERPHLDSLWFTLSDLYEKKGDIDAAFKAAYNCKRALQKSENPNPQNLADVEARINVLRR
jgi:serine/threonine protein kinase